MSQPEMHYYYNGIEVPQSQALALWKSSRTYDRAAYKESIWPNAHQAGSPHQHVAKVHLEEAGITIERKQPNT